MTQPNFPKCYKVESKPHMFCPGCGHPIVLKMLGEVIDEMGIQDKTVFLIDIGCSLLAWDFFDVDTSQTHHGRTVPVAVGFKRASPDAIVIAYQGDGGGYAIGMSQTIHSAYRNEPITTILVNNSLYAMTGGQLAPTTLMDQSTGTAPFGREDADNGKPLHGPEFLKNVVDPSAYLARGSVLTPLVLKQYLRKAIENQINNKAFSFVEAISLCPLNWKSNARETLEMGKKLEGVYKVGEIQVPEDGDK